MSDTFSTWQLFFDGSGSPALRSMDLAVQPGQPFPEPDTDETVYLASGFLVLHPDSTILLSPTLQLNADLSDFDEDMLAATGRAELNRFNGLRFRSYTVEADASVIVLGSTAEQLNSFIDTYGGVLQITPLLSEGFCETFETAVEPTISSVENSTTDKIQIQYLVRQPLDTDLCTLCGKCGAICPENCISEQLSLDLSRCTQCNECVKVCPTNAIDLHAVVPTKVEAPALIALDGMTTKLPQDSSHIYTVNNLDKLFATIYQYQIDEVISCDHTICQYIGRFQTGCRLCLTGCPAGAISTSDNGMVINQQQCTECGNCVAVCPTGAMQYLRFDDQAFIDYFSSIDLQPGCTVVLGSEEQLHKFWWSSNRKKDQKYRDCFFLEYPQVECLNSLHLLFLIARGVSRIVLLTANNLNGVKDQITATNTVIKGLFDCAKPVQVADVSSLDTILTQKVEPLITKPMRGNGFINRREKLMSILQFLQQTSGRSVELSGKPFATFGRIECDVDKCTLCLACLNECRMEALQSNEEKWSLNHRTLACVQCGTCVQVCPEKALQRVHGITLDEKVFDIRLLAQADPMKCKECGKIFGNRQSFERVMSILRQKGTQENLELYEYCDNCRVVHLYMGGK